MGRKENAGAGVTLIELVVALTLGAIIMMAIVAMYSSSTKMLFGSVKGYQNQVEASLAVENMARRLENAVWVNVVSATNLCAAVEVYDTGKKESVFDVNGYYVDDQGVLILDGSGDPILTKPGLKDQYDRYHKYFYDAGSKEFRHSNCTINCVDDLSSPGDNDCGDDYSVLASRLDTFSFVQQGADSQNANEKNVIKVEFQGGADSDNRKSVQVTKINLRGRGSYGYYD